MSTISSGTTLTTAFKAAGDTTGALVFQTNDTGSGGTTAMTITTAGGVAFGTSGTAYGTSGQVLTSAGNAAPTWSTLSASSPIATMDVKTSGTSATWTIPTGVTKVRITVVGGGGSGSADGGGGGGGGTAIKVLTNLVAGSLTYTVGGAGASSQVTSGSNNTITTVSATAGSASSTSSGLGGTGGVGSNGDINFRGGGGVANALDLGATQPVGGAGGSSFFGGGAPGNTNTTAAAGSTYGGGGAGSHTSGGAGGAGVIIFEY